MRKPVVLASLTSLILVALLVAEPLTERSTAGPQGVVDAVAMRNYRLYDNSENLIPDTSRAVWIEPGDPVPDAEMVLIDNGTARPFIVRAAAQREVLRNQNVTADLWIHTTGPVDDLLLEVHEHVDTHPTTGEIRRDFYKWKYQYIPGIVRSVPSAGWHRIDLWQQRSNGPTIMDIHMGDQDRAGFSRLNAEVSWVTT